MPAVGIRKEQSTALWSCRMCPSAWTCDICGRYSGTDKPHLHVYLDGHSYGYVCSQECAEVFIDDYAAGELDKRKNIT